MLSNSLNYKDLSIKELLYKLVSIPSINYTSGEADIAKFIYEYLKVISEGVSGVEVFMQPIKGDPIHRSNVIAILEGQSNLRKSDKAIVMLGHFDTVDVEDYGILKPFAFDPEILKNKMMEIKPDIVSDDVGFGRGIFDMKAGIAVNMILFKSLVENIDKFSGYVIFLFVCDEEGDSKGMLNALYALRDFKERFGLNYLFCLDTDYSNEKAVYLGSIGKVLIGLLVKGVESHVGQAWEGINSNYILSSICQDIEENVDLIEKVDDQFTSYPVVLKMKSLRDSYNVKTNLYSFAYVNHLFFEDDLKTIVEKYKKLVNNTLERIVSKRKFLIENLNLEFDYSFSNGINVFTMDQLVKTYGDFNSYRSFGNSDYREDIVLSLVNWVDEKGLRGPFVLLFLLSPYYPSVKTSFSLRQNVENYLKSLKREKEFKIYNYFPFISDLSFLSKVQEIDFVRKNLLGWGRYYHIDFDVMNYVSMDVMDWGVVGFDAHKFTERLVISYSLYDLPHLIMDFVLSFLYD